jgi:RNA polymerase sporulation-specific sigma factor
MFVRILQFFATKFLYLALHLDSGSFPRPLSPQREKETLDALRQGDLQARDRLIRHNLRLVAHIAKKYYAAPGDQEDLVSIGTIGLIKAVNTFDAARRARFSTYASRCIENEIRMYLRRGRRMPATVSLQDSVEAGRDGTTLTVQDTIPDESRMEEACEQTDEARRLRQLIDGLNGRERQVILLRYGLGGQLPLTQQQTAELLGISRSYVSRLETRAMGQLKKEIGEMPCHGNG